MHSSPVSRGSAACSWMRPRLAARVVADKVAMVGMMNFILYNFVCDLFV